MFNLPNSITISRLFLTAIFVLAVSLEAAIWTHIALASFSVAAITDYLDGYLARKMNLVTPLGKLLDPLADKILVCSGFVYLSVESASNDAISFCPLWVTCIILGREFMVTGLRQIAVEKGVILAADSLGKWKTTFQLIFQIGVLTQLSLGPFDDSQSILAKPFTFLADKDHYLVNVSLWIALILTLISGWNYLWNSRQLLK
jgi:CDP-diacylglycerol--glycerol-3-phosphate 3-phosphatidyltransferase